MANEALWTDRLIGDIRWTVDLDLFILAQV